MTDTVHAFTLDSLTKVRQVASLCAGLPRTMVRVVLDEYADPVDYVDPFQRLHSAGVPVMAELLDSFYVGRFTLTQFKDRAVNFYRMLNQYVSVWEIANEVNGEWLGTTADVVAKAKIAYALCSGKPRAVTLYFNQDCWEKADHEMWAWTAHNLSVSTWPPEYLLVSYYEQDCNKLLLTTSQWTSVFARLSAMFPSAKVGFGEMGAPRGSTLAQKQEVMNRYYRMTGAIQAVVPNYIGGYFWWYGAQDLFTRTGAGPLWPAYAPYAR
jgi:hypothetical protein